MADVEPPGMVVVVYVQSTNVPCTLPIRKNDTYLCISASNQELQVVCMRWSPYRIHIPLFFFFFLFLSGAGTGRSRRRGKRCRNDKYSPPLDTSYPKVFCAKRPKPKGHKSMPVFAMADSGLSSLLLKRQDLLVRHKFGIIPFHC